MEDLLPNHELQPKKKFTVRALAQGAIIAAVYALLTIFLAPISSGLIQCRVSEAMSVLPYFTFSAVPGLFIGCLIANLLLGASIYDVLFGSLATLIAAYITYAMRKHVTKYLAPLPSVIVNALVVGWLLTYVYQVGVSFWVAAGYVAVGQAIACFALGIPLMKLLERFRDKLFVESEAQRIE
ncbi:MAG: hypothetical protein CVV04_03960 [Firmicutes bacterium HGW-Firmicutes-9]|jgi:uncharacterized membrane protein|nr:MAG: hypothetical protein CVV04_03960 [Firmicutes bacterium HGW-Firmicutes-9]